MHKMVRTGSCTARGRLTSAACRDTVAQDQPDPSCSSLCIDTYILYIARILQEDSRPAVARARVPLRTSRQKSHTHNTELRPREACPDPPTSHAAPPTPAPQYGLPRTEGHPGRDRGQVDDAHRRRGPRQLRALRGPGRRAARARGAGQGARGPADGRDAAPRVAKGAAAGRLCGCRASACIARA